MTKLTKEFMQDIISCNGFGLAPSAVTEMARQLLASMEQEPVAYMTYKGYLLHAADPKLAEYSEPMPLYTAPPAPVVPEGLRMALSNAGIAAPESDEMLAATHEKYIQALVTWVKDRKPFQPAQLVPEEVSWEDVPEEITEDNMEVALAWAHGFNHCRAAMLKAGNSPVTPYTWIPVSERMPAECDFDIWVFSPSKGIHDGVRWDGCEFADDEYQFKINDVSHWMKKTYPAAPQQEGNS